MINFQSNCLSTSEHRALKLIRECGVAIAKGGQPCAGKGGCGLTCARRAMMILMSLLATKGRRTITLHGPKHQMISPDEMSLLCLIAADQQEEDHLAKSLTLWLVPAHQSAQFRETSSLLGEILAKDGHVLPLRFMAPPSRRQTTSGFYALQRPLEQENVALPITRTH